MKATKIITALSLLALSATWVSAYDEVKCTTDPAFSANSCNQCFTGKAKWEGATLGFLKDKWVNPSTVDKILYKEEQSEPKMVNLNPSLVTWKEIPGKAGFWEYTPEFNKLYRTEEEGFVLGKGKSVIWLKSKDNFAYKLSKNKAPKWKNIGLLVYPITTHNILATGDINVDGSEHRECVLFKSDTKGAPVKPVVQTSNPIQTATHNPVTWPEDYVLLMLLAMILGFGFTKIRKKA